MPAVRSDSSIAKAADDEEHLHAVLPPGNEQPGGSPVPEDHAESRREVESQDRERRKSAQRVEPRKAFARARRIEHEAPILCEVGEGWSRLRPRALLSSRWHSWHASPSVGLSSFGDLVRHEACSS